MEPLAFGREYLRRAILPLNIPCTIISETISKEVSHKSLVYQPPKKFGLPCLDNSSEVTILRARIYESWIPSNPTSKKGQERVIR